MTRFGPGLKARIVVKACILMLSMSSVCLPVAAARHTDWQPMSSERLIKLPASVMERALEYDFQNSILASKLIQVDNQLGMTQQDLASIQQSITQAEGEGKVELRHQFLEQKSSYIDHMESRQHLRRMELQTRISIYQGLLSDMKTDQRRANDPVSSEVRRKQQAARARMESIAEQVDESLFDMAAQEKSQYAQEYGTNIQKIKQLQLAIREHSLHRNLNDSNAQLTRQAYIRQLLADAEADVALLNQEDEMLGYMARLVAMDAQALQIELTYGSLEPGASNQRVAAAKAANMVDFFTH